MHLATTRFFLLLSYLASNVYSAPTTSALAAALSKVNNSDVVELNNGSVCNQTEPCRVGAVTGGLRMCNCEAGQVCGGSAEQEQTFRTRYNNVDYDFCSAADIPICEDGQTAWKVVGYRQSVLCWCPPPYKLMSLKWEPESDTSVYRCTLVPTCPEEGDYCGVRQKATNGRTHLITYCTCPADMGCEEVPGKTMLTPWFVQSALFACKLTANAQSSIVST